MFGSVHKETLRFNPLRRRQRYFEQGKLSPRMDSCMIAADAAAGSDVEDFYEVGIDIDFVTKTLTAGF